jgi:hypothetical protein
MIVAISSHKPFYRASNEVKENQIRASKSWNMVFTGIVYFGRAEPELTTPKTSFVPSTKPPSIKEMALKASHFIGWSCLLNADIVVRPELIKVWLDLTKVNAVCALSKRFDLVTGKHLKDDNGLDIFLATQAVWRRVAREIPEQFKIGSQMWDTWMASFFATNYPDKCYDFTPSEVVFHPKHENRAYQEIDVPTDRYLAKTLYPAYILKI